LQQLAPPPACHALQEAMRPAAGQAPASHALAADTLPGQPCIPPHMHFLKQACMHNKVGPLCLIYIVFAHVVDHVLGAGQGPPYATRARPVLLRQWLPSLSYMGGTARYFWVGKIVGSTADLGQEKQRKGRIFLRSCCSTSRVGERQRKGKIFLRSCCSTSRVGERQRKKRIFLRSCCSRTGGSNSIFFLGCASSSDGMMHSNLQAIGILRKSSFLE
jgi:hypothetical protein